MDFLHGDTVFLRRIYALIAVAHGSRRAYLAGATARPTGVWTTQAARNLLMDFADRVAGLRRSGWQRSANHDRRSTDGPQLRNV